MTYRKQKKKRRGKFYIQSKIAVYGVECDIQSSQLYSMS